MSTIEVAGLNRELKFLFIYCGLSLTDGVATFRSFLRSEFSEENIEFWIACENFKKTRNPMKMATKAQKIYEDFIQTGGPKEVGLKPSKILLLAYSSSLWSKQIFSCANVLWDYHIYMNTLCTCPFSVEDLLKTQKEKLSECKCKRDWGFRDEWMSLTVLSKVMCAFKHIGNKRVEHSFQTDKRLHYLNQSPGWYQEL